MTDHVASSTNAQSDTYRMLGVKGIDVGQLASLYTEGSRLWATIKAPILVVALAIMDIWVYFAAFLAVIVKDVAICLALTTHLRSSSGR